MRRGQVREILSSPPMLLREHRRTNYYARFQLICQNLPKTTYTASGAQAQYHGPVAWQSPSSILRTLACSQNRNVLPNKSFPFEVVVGHRQTKRANSVKVAGSKPNAHYVEVTVTVWPGQARRP